MGGTHEPLRVWLTRDNGTAVVRLDGELDCATAPRLEAVLHDVLAGRDVPRRVVVDASRLAFVDVAGLGPLLWGASRLPGGFELRNAAPNVLRVIRVLDLVDELGAG